MANDPIAEPILGLPVLRTKVAISNTGDGLSKALAIRPQVFDPDKPVYVVLRCNPKGVKLDHIELEDEQLRGWELVNRLKAGLATVIPEDVVKGWLDDQQRELDAAAGIVRLPGIDGPTGDDDDLAAEVKAIAGRKGKKRPEDDLAQIDEEPHGNASSG